MEATSNIEYVIAFNLFNPGKSGKLIPIAFYPERLGRPLPIALTPKDWEGCSKSLFNPEGFGRLLPIAFNPEGVRSLLSIRILNPKGLGWKRPLNRF
jgi:hypothetical protein